MEICIYIILYSFLMGQKHPLAQMRGQVGKATESSQGQPTNSCAWFPVSVVQRSEPLRDGIVTGNFNMQMESTCVTCEHCGASVTTASFDPE